ncbi:MAG: hypothetical protein ACI9SD_001436 [Pseudohongiellaceae bacterium]|jgi:hypothetical protein
MIPIFIFGASRSGTTLLASRLGGNQEIITLPEMQFLYKKLSESTFKNDSVFCGRSWVESLGQDYSFCNLNLTDLFVQNLIKKSKGLNFKDIVLLIVQQYALQHKKINCKYFLDHSPISRRYVKQLREIFEAPTFINLYRDPRAVYSSIKHLSWGPNTPTYFSRWWLKSIAEGFSNEVLNANLIHVKFEHLVLESESELKRLCDFIGIQFDKIMLTGDGFQVPVYTQKQHSLVKNKINHTVLSKWEEGLNQYEKSVICKRCESTASNLGYNFKHYKTPIEFRFGILLEVIIEMFSIPLGQIKQKLKRQSIVKSSK